MYETIKNNENSMLGFFVEKDFNNKTKYTRSIVNFGEPLKGFNSSIDRAEEQRDLYKKFYTDIEEKYWKMFKVNNTIFRSGYMDPLILDDLHVKYYSWNLNALEFTRVINGDITWTLCSILFVSIWIRVHTGSFFTTAFSMLQIILSMPFAFIFYRLVFGITYFTQLHGCVIFLALGIGADDIFVFSDSWKQNKKNKTLTTVEVLDLTMQRTILAVFNTSFTTTVAFLATATSPAMPVSSFGIYAALTIITNYLFVILFTPTVIMIKEDYYDKLFTCFKKVHDDNNGDVEMVATNIEKKEEQDSFSSVESIEENQDKIKANDASDLYKMQSTKKVNSIELEDTINSEEVKIIGLYDPENYSLDINMWSNSNGDQLKNIFVKLNKLDLSKDASEIIKISLLTNAHSPKKIYLTKIF